MLFQSTGAVKKTSKLKLTVTASHAHRSAIIIVSAGDGRPEFVV